MTDEDGAVRAFLEARDLGVLAKGLAFSKTSHFTESQHSFAVKWFMWLGCVPCLAPIATFKPESLYPHFALKLYSDRVEVSFPVNWCCSVSVKTTRIMLDSIMDVTINTEDKYNQQFGLKQIDIWAYGEKGSCASVPWVANPEQARDAILLAVNLHKAATGRVPWPAEAIPASLEAATGAAANPTTAAATATNPVGGTAAAAAPVTGAAAAAAADPVTATAAAANPDTATAAAAAPVTEAAAAANPVAPAASAGAAAANPVAGTAAAANPVTATAAAAANPVTATAAGAAGTVTVEAIPASPKAAASGNGAGASVAA